MSSISKKQSTKRVILAYSGGLDTSVILVWLRKELGYEVVTFTADIGQVDNHEEIKANAIKHGAIDTVVEDLQETFIRDYVFPMFRANTIYEGAYLLGTSIARPLIGRRQVEIAHTYQAQAVSHGATGKGNDQVRFELAYQATDPDMEIIAPWRQWDLSSRPDLIAFAKANQIHVPLDKSGEPPFSIDENLLHISAEGKVLEDANKQAPADVYTLTTDPLDAPNEPEDICIGFEKGDPVHINNEQLSPVAFMHKLNALASKHGVGRDDIVENRFVGIKSRGIYETPAGTVLLKAHRAIESITLDREAAHLKDDIMPRYAKLIYNGFWFAPERKMLQALIDESQHYVSGEVLIRLYKGNCSVLTRSSPNSLYNQKQASFDEQSDYDQSDAQGFIALQGLRLRNYVRKHGKI